MNTNKLPQFKTLDEWVAFWDDHDFTDYIDQMEEVDPRQFYGRLEVTLEMVV